MTIAIDETSDELLVSTFCAMCGEPFLKQSKAHRFCSDACRYRSTDRLNPAYRAAMKARCDRWYREKHPNALRVVSLSGAPYIGEYLPGAAVVISFANGRVPPLEHGRHMHAALTRLLGVPHDELLPTFAASPYSGGWGVYSPNLDAIKSIAQIRDVVRIGEERIEISIGPLMRLRSPKIEKRGWRTIRVDTISPVVIKSTSSKTGQTVVRQLGVSQLLNGSLAAFAKLRFGLDIGDKICCEVTSHETTRESIQLHGKLGTIRGFSGSLIVRCNAVGEWLLRVAEQISMGSRVGFGFGRIRVSSVDAQPKELHPNLGFFVTPHAIERYTQRVHRGIQYEQALSEILQEARGAHYVKNYGSAEYWRCGKPMRLRLIVGRVNPGLPQIMTILPGHT
jgi:hypothetical protein